MAIQNRVTVTVQCDIKGCDESETFGVQDTRMVQPVPVDAQTSGWLEVRHLGQPLTPQSKYICPKHGFSLLGTKPNKD